MLLVYGLNMCFRQKTT